MIRKSCVLGTFLMLAATFCGCQSWSQGGFPLQGVSRVPPPGTGTYQMPNGYYNNQTSAVAPSGQVITASTSGGLRPAGAGSLPTTNLTDSNGSLGQVQTAQFTQPSGPSSIEVMDGSSGPPQGFQGSAAKSQATFTDSNAAAFDTSDLQWQP